MRTCFWTAVALLWTSWSAAATVVDFEDLNLGPQSYVNNSLGFSSRGAGFNNSFTDFQNGFTYWGGFSYSSRTDITTAGFGNQYSAFAPTPSVDGSQNFAVGSWSAFEPDYVTLPTGNRPVSVQVANTTYTALSMRDGDAFAKKFGGVTGNDPDYLLLTIIGLNASNVEIGSVPVYLADFRAAGTAQDYILGTWKSVDLSSLASAVKLTFSMESTDVGNFGINTPTYFALDNLTVTAVPEPTSWCLALLGAVGLLAARRRV